MSKHNVCTEAELKASGRIVAKINGAEILVVNADGRYFAVDNICPHAQTRLESGRIEEETLTCSNHGTCFDLKTGEIRTDRIDEDLLEMIDVDNLPFGPLNTFPLTVEGAYIVVEV